VSALASRLPGRFPIFPLRGALLLPGGNLPLNIFEPRYLQMVKDAMQTHRVVGMVQPRHDKDPSPAPALYRTGCIGQITNFAETDDGRFLITLTGVCRFDIVEELEASTPYRQVVGDFAPWRQDLHPPSPPIELKDSLLMVLKTYFEHHGIEAEWDAIETAPFAGLVTSLCMICPFEPEEKQALLEAADIGRQTRLLIALMQMEALAEAGTSTATRH
jgi:Lon protease-like protein